MTKQEKQRYREEYERGEHMLTLEQYMKEDRKQKRSQKGRDETLVRKIARELLSGTMEELERLRAENADLKKRVEQLTADDVPAAEPERPVPRPDEKQARDAAADSDIPGDIYSASLACMILGQEGVRICRELEWIVSNRGITAENANKTAEGLGFDRRWERLCVAGPATVAERNRREKFRKDAAAAISKIHNDR